MMFDWLRAQLGRLAGRRVRGLSLVANYLANVLWLVENTWHSLIKEGYGRNSIAYSAIRLLSQSIPEARMRAYVGEEEDREPLPLTHPLMQLIRRPNAFMTEFEFWELATIQLAAVGRSVWWKERANGGQVLALWPLRPDRVGPIYSSDPNVPVLAGWAYVDPQAQAHLLPASDCICFLFPDADGESGGLVEGFGPLSAARADLSADNSATTHIGALLANYAQPGMALKIKDSIDEDTANLIKAKFRQEFGGMRLGTPAVLDAGAEIQMLGFSLKDLEFSGLRSDTESRICAALGVPSILVGANSGLESSTYSNIEGLRAFFTETTLSFYWRRYADQMTNDLAPEYGDGITCEFDTSTVKALADQFAKHLAPWKEAFAAGAISIDQYLVKLGLEPLPGVLGQVRLVPSNVTAEPATEEARAELEQRAEQKAQQEQERLEAQREQQIAIAQQKPQQQREQSEQEQPIGSNGHGMRMSAALQAAIAGALEAAEGVSEIKQVFDDAWRGYP